MIFASHSKKIITVLTSLVFTILSFQNCAEAPEVSPSEGLVPLQMDGEMMSVSIFPALQQDGNMQKISDLNLNVDEGIKINLEENTQLSEEMHAELKLRLKETAFCQKVYTLPEHTNVACSMLYMAPAFLIESSGHSRMTFDFEQDAGPCQQHGYTVCPVDLEDFRDFYQRLSDDLINHL